MKKTLFSLFALLFVASYSIAQKKPASPPMTAESSMVTVKYNAPSKKGREIFGGLVPFEKVWRTGANGATEVTFAKDVNFGGTDVKAGTYSLFTIPGEQEWKVILNPTLKQWGAYDYKKIKDKDVAVVTVPSMSTDSEMEMFTIMVTDSELKMAWDMTMVAVPLKF